MNHLRATVAVVVLLIVVSFAPATVNAKGELSSSQARRALTRIPWFELKSGAVRVKSVSGSATQPTVSADLRLVFKFEADKDGKWRVAEVRTGQDRWERIDAIAAALRASTSQGDCNAPDPPLKNRVPTDPSVKRARCLLASLFSVDLPSDAVRVQEVAPMAIPFATQPSATVIAWIGVDARLTQDKSGWRVSDVRTANREWVAIDLLTASLNEEKRQRARADLELIAAALQKFRKERGFYVVSDSEAVVIDHLSPRYLARVIRLDPWNQPYQYLGERDQFRLTSIGPDGKAHTPDDILLNEPR